MRKLLVLAFAMMVGVAAHANGNLYWEDDRFELGKRSDETATEYEMRVCEARKVLEESRAYIDSNMLWVDNQDFQKTLDKYH